MSGTMGAVRRVAMREGAAMPALGLGTWEMGVDAANKADEAAALKYGLDLGMGLIDTAEMYADGGAEEVVCEAIEGRRDEVYLVSKVLPENASFDGTLKACEKSLKRLGTDRLDLYLLHWIGELPVAETLEALDRLKRDGKIIQYGVSNFDLDAMREAEDTPLGRRVVSNQLLYNLEHRTIDFELLDWCWARGISVMAYAPLYQAKLESKAALKDVAERHGVTPESIAIAWTLRHPALISIPKAVKREHIDTNRQAIEINLSEDDLAALDRDYPPPTEEGGIEMV